MQHEGLDLFSEMRSSVRFSAQLRVFPVSFLPGSTRSSMNYGSKIILPPSALARLGQLNIDYPMCFVLHNEINKKHTHAGVLEFIADEGHVYAPQWILTALDLSHGELIRIENIKLPLGTFVKIEPQSVDFLDIHDPRAVLEQAFRNYSTLTRGDTISLMYNNKQFDIRLLELKPADAVSIIETDLEVDFAPPVGYVEPKYIKGSNNGLTNDLDIMSMSGEVLNKVNKPSPKKVGNILSSRRIKTIDPKLTEEKKQKSGKELLSDILSNPDSRSLDLPLGQLFFGFPEVTPPPESLDPIENSDLLKKRIPFGGSGSGHSLKD